MTMAYKDSSKRCTIACKDREVSIRLAKEPPNWSYDLKQKFGGEKDKDSNKTGNCSLKTKQHSAPLDWFSVLSYNIEFIFKFHKLLKDAMKLCLSI